MRGKTWTPLTDDYPNMDAFSLAIHPENNDTYFWGSYNGSIYKTTDGGNTWRRIGKAGSGSVNQIVFHPNDANVMFASSRRDGDGIYRSTNGGDSWSRVAQDNSAHDIEFMPGNPNIVYASGRKFHKSTDGGRSFVTREEGFNTSVKIMAVTPANPNKLYIVQEEQGRFNAFFVSENQGDSFEKKDHGDKNYFGYSSTADDMGGQAPRDMDIVASATDENEVHIAGILSWISTDGGNSFKVSSQWTPGSARQENIGYCHADIDMMEMVNGKLYVASDGGIFVADETRNVTSEYYRDLTTGLGIRAFYRFGISQTDPVVITAGSQDNGSSTYTDSRGWTDWMGADGMEGFVDKNNSQIIYGSSQFGGLAKSFDQGRRREGLGQPGDDGNWITPFLQDPIDDNIIYAGFKRAYKSENGGDDWTEISQEFERGLDHLEIAPSDNSVLYAAIRGDFFVETNGDGNWTKRDAISDGIRINSMSIHPKNPEKIAVAVTGSSKVYVSKDSGRTWTSLRNNLPDFSALSVTWEDNNKDGLYVGMNYGIYYTDNTLPEWEPFSNKLPNVRVNELEINYTDGKIYAATYGRGIWSSPVYQSKLLSNTSITNNAAQAISIYPNPTEDIINIQWNEGTNAALRIFNNEGRLLYLAKDVSLKDQFTVDLGTFAKGIYFVRINSDQGVFTRKVLLNK